VRLAATPTVAVPPVTGDRAALARTVTNLLDNAVHHAPAGSAVEVGLRVDGPRVIVAISNDGPGVPVEDRERIFDRFVRLDEARARDEGGSGLGLSISRAIARSHGGDVRCVDPVSGHGATFELFLPFVNAGTGEGREDDHSSDAGHGA
jgi:signal transduction histidine kinase